MQKSIHCSVYRGGTSRGVFFKKQDLPSNIEERNQIFYSAIDADNPSQINGLGSGTSHTSKVMVISDSSRKDADIEFTFYQIGIGTRVVDSRGTCGNLMAAVGAFTVNEQMVEVSENQEFVKVSAYNTNIDRVIEIDVPVINQKSKISGDFEIPGLKNSGAPYNVSIVNPGGGKLGETYPLGKLDVVAIENKRIEVTLSDIVNPFIYLSSQALGLKGNESVAEISNNERTMQLIEKIRRHYSMRCGLTKSMEEAASYQSIPKVALIAPPMDYDTPSGVRVTSDEIDITARMLSMGKVHRTFAGSGLYNLAGTSLTEGTLPNSMIEKHSGTALRIGHPEGVIKVEASVTDKAVHSVRLQRTARLIMRGEVFSSM